MKIGFIGSGKMASALVEGILRAGAFKKDEIMVSDRFAKLAQDLAKKTGVTFSVDNGSLATDADVLVLCVKPGDAPEALRQVSHQISGKLVVSIVAGTPLPALQRFAGENVRVVRVMPNTP